MDLSNIYLRLCANKELQDSSELVLGNYVAILVDGEYLVGRLNDINVGREGKGEILERVSIFYNVVDPIKFEKPLGFELIKLYELDEIMETIIIEKDITFFRLMVEFNHFYLKNICNEDLSSVFSSGEMCWLAFYMYTLHNKEWDGSEWVKLRKR